ncbi:MAG: Hpt domain-containing protein [Burkholderiaceae bacterium]|nr:Hpt domain-containing protein [Burkholderiaceae bacterium]
MQLDDTQKAPVIDVAVKDLGPLAWVFDELRKSLDTAVKGLRRFAREADVVHGSDLAAADPNHLRGARQQLHQVVGALSMLGLREPVLIVSAMELAVQRFVQRPALTTEDAVSKLERTSFAVMEYLECLLSGKAVSAVALFVQYRDVRILAGIERVHPAELWIRESFNWLDPNMPECQVPLQYDPSVRSAMDSALLKVMQTADKQAARELSQLSLGLSATQINFKAKVFWKICAAFFEAISQQLLPADLYVKRAASGVVIHYKNLTHGDWVFSDKFMHGMLFFCDQAPLKDTTMAPCLAAIKQAWALTTIAPVDYEVSQYGHFDPAVVALSRKRIVVAKELWTGLSSGDIQKIRGTAEQFKLVTDSLLKLYPSSRPLALALTNAIDTVVSTKTPPHTELAMEVATAILYLEAVFEETGSTDAEMALRATGLAERMEHVRMGGQAKTVEPWIEDLYRRVSDRESMGSVVGELRICLTDIEKSIDHYFRAPSDQAALQAVPSKLGQMRGIFSVLGLEQASSAVTGMRESVEEFSRPEFDFEHARTAGLIDKFGNNLGALGFLIDMLNYQPALVKKLFVFDDETGDLNPLMGRIANHTEAHIPAVLTALPVVSIVESQSTAAAVLPGEVVSADASAVSEQLQADELAALKFEQQIEDDLELKNIFFEEANEVIANGQSTVETLLSTPNNLEAQSTLRRVFHTLKGSSRMVGLTEFGDAAWSFEQLINTKLADQAPFEANLCTLSASALYTFSLWVQDLVANKAAHWTAIAFRRAADAMRIENRLDAQDLLSPITAHHAPEVLEPEATTTHDVVFVPTQTETERAALPISHGSPVLSELPAFSEPAIVAEAISQEQPVIPLDDAPVPAKEQKLLDAADTHAEPIPHETDVVSQVQPNQEFKPELNLTSDSSNFALNELSVQAPEAAQTDDSLATQLVIDQHEEQFKVIGSLKIGIPLYNVYLNEADEWARRLVTELDEWSMELHRPLQNSTVGLAHSLAGSSATVGFHRLAELAKLLELALERAYQRPSGTPELAKLFSSAAEECHRLLHQFAAGFLKEPNEQLLYQLANLKIVDISREPVASVETTKPTMSPLAIVPSKAHFATIVSATPAIHKVLGHKQAQVQNHNDDDIELVDSLDADLFHIFEEEAQELLPRLGSALRQWVTRPDNLSARSEILRTLHTLKGSSRLAGAMRLGELSHRMESEIEELGSENLTDELLEPLLVRLDVLQNTFDGLSSPGEVEMPMVLDALPSLTSKEDQPKPDKLVNDELIAPVDAKVVAKSIVAPAAASVLLSEKKESRQSVRVRARLLDRLVNQAGEVMLTRTRIESELGSLRGSLGDLTSNLDRLRQQLRDVEFQAETQMQSRMEQAKDSQKGFDPLEFDRFTRVQELTRMMAESVNDVATVQRSLQRTVELTEDDLVAQARQTRDLQRDLLRTRMEEFESISDRLYRVVRQASKETSKLVKLDIVGGSIEMDRGVLERMTPSFEHLLRNCVAHGIESAELRLKSGKDLTGAIAISLLQDGNDVVIEFSDDGAGLDYQRIRDQAISQKLIAADSKLSDVEMTNLIFTPGLSTASQVTELSGRGIGLDVVRSEIMALGGRIEVASEAKAGTRFKLVLPLTTAVTQVVMMRSGALSFGVPSHLVEIVRRAPTGDVKQAYVNGFWGAQEDALPFYWSGALLQASQRSVEPLLKTSPVIIFRSAGQRIAIHVDEVLGNKEVVIKNLGPQLARLPGLAGMAILVSGAVALIYNPVALAAVYGVAAQQFSASQVPIHTKVAGGIAEPLQAVDDQLTPLVLVVDDSITVRRVTQRMLQREGFRVVLAVDGLQAIEKLGDEIPAVVLSDIEMPRMDGFDLVRNIRADARLKHLPIVMITSRIAEKHRELAKELGVNNYLGKPYSEEGLLAVLRQHTMQATPATDEVAV